MSAASFVQYCYLAHFSKPGADRLIYRKIHQLSATRIVELGVGDCERAQRMISVAKAQAGEMEVSYTGIDQFELRPPDQPRMTLKNAYRRLRSSGASIKLIPGDPYAALARKANSLSGCDLVVVHADQDPTALGRAWFYVPRMLHPQSLVLLEQPNGEAEEPIYRVLTLPELEHLGRRHSAAGRAA